MNILKTTKLLGIILLIVFTISSKLKAHLLDEVPLIDGHNDLPHNLYRLLHNNLTDYEFDTNLSKDSVWGRQNCLSCSTDIPRLRQGKVGAQFWVAYVSCPSQYKDAVAKTLEQIDVIKRLVNKYPNHLQFATSTADIMTSFQNSKIASLIGVEGGHSIDSRLGVLRMFYDLGVRYLTLTQACSTPWADSAFVDKSGPVHNLTNFGKLIIHEMNRLGMLVDLSHVSHNVMNQAILESKAPVIFSHSSAYAVRHHNRNVRDDTLKLLKENSGIIMVNFYSGFVAYNRSHASISDVAAHLNYIVDIAGHENVGIGGDFDGASAFPKELEDVSKYPNLFNFLQKENPGRWTNYNLKLLAAENFLRVFREVERVRDSLITNEPYQQWIDVKDLKGLNKDAFWNCRTFVNRSNWQPEEENRSPSLKTLPMLLPFNLHGLSLLDNKIVFPFFCPRLYMHFWKSVSTSPSESVGHANEPIFSFSSLFEILENLNNV